MPLSSLFGLTGAALVAMTIPLVLCHVIFFYPRVYHFSKHNKWASGSLNKVGPRAVSSVVSRRAITALSTLTI
jgi:hypothetical protein